MKATSVFLGCLGMLVGASTLMPAYASISRESRPASLVALSGKPVALGVGQAVEVKDTFLVIGAQASDVKVTASSSSNLTMALRGCEPANGKALGWVRCTSVLTRIASGAGSYDLRARVNTASATSHRVVTEPGATLPTPQPTSTPNPSASPTSTPTVPGEGKLTLVRDLHPLLPPMMPMGVPKSFTWQFDLVGTQAASATASAVAKFGPGLDVMVEGCKTVTYDKAVKVECAVRVTKKARGMDSYHLEVTAIAGEERTSATYTRFVEDSP